MAEKPLIQYHPIASSHMYICHGCNGMAHISESEVIHLPECLHYPSDGNYKLEERLKTQGLFKGSLWDLENKDSKEP